MEPKTITMQDFTDSARKAEQTIRRAVATADGLDAKRVNARLAFDFEAERNEQINNRLEAD